jgi:ATP-dependent RNA helicase SUPV3L1/SUV3
MASISKSSVPTTSAPSHLDESALDALTAGAFSATTSGDRAAKIREWLATDPPPTSVQEVFREMSSKDKGAAKPLRERLDELKRQKMQESIAEEWAKKALSLLAQDKLNIADAMAWQRDAAKAGAGLSREPLASIKQQLAARISTIEDLQHSCQVQREAAVLLAQRTEVLSTKSFSDVQNAVEGLGKDFENWQAQANALVQNPNWASVDAKFPAALDASGHQLSAVWRAFHDAVTQMQLALADATAPLPNVPVWADEVRMSRGVVEAVARPAKAKVDPSVRAAAIAQVGQVLKHLETELALGHGKATALAAGALRNALKEYAAHIDSKLEGQAHMALGAAGELEGWQRWRADQIRQELVGKAQALMNRPAGQALGGKKIQEQLRTLRDQWKATDQGGQPNHALWKKFDEACNEAHQVVDQWIEKVKAENAVNKEQRLALIAEVMAWAEHHAAGPDWKNVNRGISQFMQRWQDAGHVNEKTYGEIQTQWKAALDAASGPLRAMQNQSIELRKQMTAEADALGAAPQLNVSAVKSLQQRWQAEAQRVPLDRKFEQKLWDRFRKPVDDAFSRKTQEREQAAQAMGEHDRRVAEAAQTLQQVSQQGDAAAIQKAMAALRAALSGQEAAVAAHAALPVINAPDIAPLNVGSSDAEPTPTVTTAGATTDFAAVNESHEGAAPQASSPGAVAEKDQTGIDTSFAETEANTEKPVVKPAPKPVIAMRGDDRPGAKRPEPARRPGADGRLGGRSDARGAPRSDSRSDGRGSPHSDSRPDGRNRDDRYPARGLRDELPRGPRLGDAAFKAQRNAFEAAEMAMKKLAAQAHGEVVTQVLAAWQSRDPAALPTAQALGARINANARQAWAKAVGTESGAADAAANSLLRLEMATEAPTPASYLEARRALQLQLLTRRNDPAPQDTWAIDIASVLQGPFTDDNGRRLQTVLKTILRAKP